MSNKGGKRAGAGRKPGTATQKSRVVADLVALTGTSPLEVLIDCMKKAQERGDERAAAQYANMAAPYVHARLASITAKNTVEGALTLITEFPSE